MFCYSRDRAVPLSGLWQKVGKKSKLPLNALWVGGCALSQRLW